MAHLVDTSIHQEPMAASVILHWIAESHTKARDEQLGILVPWSMLGLGLVATESTLQCLPSRKQGFAGWIRSEGARSWRGFTKETILAWRDPFWAAFAHGQAARILRLKSGRLFATGKVARPATGSPTGHIRRAARAIGGTIGGEQDDLRIASALGLEFES